MTGRIRDATASNSFEAVCTHGRTSEGTAVPNKGTYHAVLHGPEPLASEPTIFSPKNRRLACLAHLHARKIIACTRVIE